MVKELFLEIGTEEIPAAFAQARAWAASGHPVLINARLAPSDFRKGSISL